MTESAPAAPDTLTVGLLGTRRGRLTLFGLLYFAQGLPLGLCLYALTVHLRRGGAPVAEIGLFMSALVAPWTLKLLWAPLVDIIRIKRFGPNRTWIVFTQSMMAITLSVLFFLDPARDFGLLSVFMLLHNVFAATQDAAIDGFAVRILPESEMAWANGIMFAGQNLGMAIGGGGSLYIASLYGFNAAFAVVLGALVSILLGVSIRIRESPVESGTGTRPGPVFHAFAGRLRTFFRELRVGFLQSGPGPRAGVLFAVMPTGAMALAYGISSALQVDLEFTESQISVSTTVTLLAAAAGCGLAGVLGDRLGVKRVLASAHLLTALPTAYLGYAISFHGLTGVTFPMFLACAIAHKASVGLLFGLCGGVFMSMTNPAVGATQFTGFMSLRNVAIAYSGYWQGLAVAGLGYGPMLWLDSLFGLLPIALIPLLRPSRARTGAA